MNKQEINRTLIELAVDQTLKGMKEDPHRSIRKMADLGRQFSRGRFQEQLFSLFQRLLTDENSPYYDMINTLLRRVDQTTVKCFGINLGYNAWTWGASLIRKNQAECRRQIPWLLKLLWSPSSGGLTIHEIASLITENRKLGTYTYWIAARGAVNGNTELFHLFSVFPDCVFLLDLSDSDCLLSEQQLSAVGECRNLMLMLPSSSGCCRTLADSLLAQKALFAVICEYSAENFYALLTKKRIDSLLSLGSVILCLKASGGCPKETRGRAGSYVLEMRMQQKFPAVLIDWYTDIERIQQIVCGDFKPLLQNG